MRKKNKTIPPAAAVKPDFVKNSSAQAEDGDYKSESWAGVQQRFNTKIQASQQASTMGSICAIHRNAIQLMDAASSAQMRGMGLMVFIFMISIIAWLGERMIWYWDEFIIPYGWKWFDFFHLVLICFFFIFVARHWIVAAWQLDMFSAENQPTIFDRKHRKVYRLLTPQDGSETQWHQVLKPIHLQMHSYDWDDMQAEYRTEMVTTGKTVSRIHRLVLVAKNAQGELLDEFSIGNSMALGPTTIPMLWEHIRRYMEEAGPAIPAGEPLQNFERPRNLWQSMGVVSPFGPKLQWWVKSVGIVPVLIIFILFPITFPFAMVWSICNWISHLSMRKTVWPDEIVELVGPVVQGPSATH